MPNRQHWSGSPIFAAFCVQFFGVLPSYISLDPKARIITLHEDNTPLIEADRLAGIITPGRDLVLFLEKEGLNPTSSLIDWVSRWPYPAYLNQLLASLDQ
jgi:hypothetical protein